MSNADINWLLSAGDVQELTPDQVLVEAGQPCNQVNFLLSGQLSMAMPYQSRENLREFAQPGRDACVGTIPCLENFLSTATIYTKTACQILTIDQEQIADKLIQDIAFAAHLYQFQTNLILRWLQALIMQSKLNPAILYQINVKEASSLFAELHDSHLDWFIAVGQQQPLLSGDILQPAYRPIEHLHVVLDGALSLNLPGDDGNDLACVFRQNIANHEQMPFQEFARIARGDVFGEMRLIQTGFSTIPMHLVQVQAIRETEILSIPRWRIVAKLLHDPGFAMHFYRVMAGLMASKYQTILAELGFLTQWNQTANDDRLLTQMARAETNFEWMIQRIQTTVTGRTIQWSYN